MSKKSTIIFLLLARTLLPAFGQNMSKGGSDDSGISGRFSIGVDMSLFSIMKYRLPNYSNLYQVPSSSCSKCPATKRSTLYGPLFLDYQGLQLGYKINRSLKLGLGISRVHEEWGDQYINVEILRPDIYKATIVGAIYNKYLGFSPSLTGFIRNNENETFFTNFEAGINIDFIYSERRKGGSIGIDSVFSPYGPNNFIDIYDEELAIEPRHKKMSFNRLSPFVILSLEWYSHSKTFSFSLGSGFTFESIYQIENTSEFYKCFKITPLTLGLSYHFNQE